MEEAARAKPNCTGTDKLNIIEVMLSVIFDDNHQSLEETLKKTKTKSEKKIIDISIGKDILIEFAKIISMSPIQENFFLPLRNILLLFDKW